MAKKRDKGKKPVRQPQLVKQTDEGEVRMSPISEMEKLIAREAELVNELEELRDQIGTLKLQRFEELKREAAALGFSLTSPGSSGSSLSSSPGKRKGRPKGFKMSEEQKEAMRLGRERARKAKAGAGS